MIEELVGKARRMRQQLTHGRRRLRRPELPGVEHLHITQLGQVRVRGLVERLTFRTLRGRGITSATVLTGSFGSLHSNERIAGKKLEITEHRPAVRRRHGPLSKVFVACAR